MTTIDFGVCIPNFRAGASPEGMLAAVQTAERLGWQSAWATDHVLIDDNERGADYQHIYEALSTLAWLAGQSSTIKLGISVLVVDMRQTGIDVRPLPELTNPDHADFNQVYFDGVEVPRENLVGEWWLRLRLEPRSELS